MFNIKNRFLKKAQFSGTSSPEYIDWSLGRAQGKKGKSRKSILKTLRLIENNNKLLQKYKEELGKQIVFLYLWGMKEILKYLVIRCTTRHAKTALEVYNTLYPKQTEVVYVEKPVYTQVENSMSVTSVPVYNSKKDEVLESLTD